MKFDVLNVNTSIIEDIKGQTFPETARSNQRATYQIEPVSKHRSKHKQSNKGCRDQKLKLRFEIQLVRRQKDSHLDKKEDTRETTKWI